MNPYNVLGISPDATEADIKKAYRKLAMQWHPDRNKSPEAASRFKEIQEAYDALTKNKPAIRWVINGEEIVVRNAEDAFRQWEEAQRLIRKMVEDFWGIHIP